jgi:hypothetical protein
VRQAAATGGRFGGGSGESLPPTGLRNARPFLSSDQLIFVALRLPPTGNSRLSASYGLGSAHGAAPEACAEHIAQFGAADDSRLFSGVRGRSAGHRDPPARLDQCPPGCPHRRGAGIAAGPAALRLAARLPVHVAERRDLPHAGRGMGRAHPFSDGRQQPLCGRPRSASGEATPAADLLLAKSIQDVQHSLWPGRFPSAVHRDPGGPRLLVSTLGVSTRYRGADGWLLLQGYLASLRPPSARAVCLRLRTLRLSRRPLRTLGGNVVTLAVPRRPLEFGLRDDCARRPLEVFDA